MKKIYIFLLVLFPITLWGQSYILTPAGLRDTEAPEKSFVVIAEKDKDASQLYHIAKSYINQTMKNPKIAIKADAENDYIRYNIFVPEIAVIKKLGVKLIAEATYTIELKFRDGRMRFEISNLNMPFKDSDNSLNLVGSNWGAWHIFKKDGKVALKDQKAQIEEHFNNYIADLADFIYNYGDDDSDEW